MEATGDKDGFLAGLAKKAPATPPVEGEAPLDPETDEGGVRPGEMFMAAMDNRDPIAIEEAIRRIIER